MNAGEEIDAIGRDLDATGAAWAAAGYPSDGPTFDAREAVFARLKAWNRRQEERLNPRGAPTAMNLSRRDRSARGE